MKKWQPKTDWCRMLYIAIAIATLSEAVGAVQAGIQPRKFCAKIKCILHLFILFITICSQISCNYIQVILRFQTVFYHQRQNIQDVIKYTVQCQPYINMGWGKGKEKDINIQLSCVYTVYLSLKASASYGYMLFPYNVLFYRNKICSLI